MSTFDVLAALTTLFGRRTACRLHRLGWKGLERAATDPDHKSRGWLDSEQLATVQAVVKICRSYYPEQSWPTTQVRCTADVVRHYAERTERLQERVVWLLCLDHDSYVIADVLVQYGGSSTEPPDVTAVLRHAIVKGASRLVVSDHRPCEEVKPNQAVLARYATLRAAAELIGFQVDDYVLHSRSGSHSILGWRGDTPRRVQAA